MATRKKFTSMLMGFDLKSSDTVKKLDQMAESLGRIDLKMSDIKEVGGKLFKGLVDAVSLRSVSKMGQAIDRLGDSVNSSVRLSSSLDSTFAAASKSGMQLAASARLTGKEMSNFRKETSFFYDLNVDAEGVQKTWMALHDAGLDVQSLGFKNLAEMTKSLQVLGVDGEQFVKQMEGLVKGLNFNPKQARQLADEILFIGRNSKVGAKFMAAMPDALGTFKDELRKLNPEMKPEQFMDMSRSMFLLAAAAEESGATTEEAIAQSKQVFTSLSQARVQFRDIMTGKGGDLPEQFKSELMALGDFAISDKPLEFIQILSKNYKSLNDDQKQFMSSYMLDNLGADIDLLVKGNFDKVSDKISNMSKSMADAGGEMNRVAKFYRDGLTDQDRYERLNAKLDHTLTGLSRRMGVQGDLLKMQAKANNAFTGTMKQLVSIHEKGTKEVSLFGIEMKKSTGEVTTAGEAAGLASRAFLSYRTAGIRGLTIEMVNSLSKHEKFQKMLGKDGDKIAGIAGEVMALAPKVLTMIATLRLAGLGFGGLGPILLPALLIGGGFLAVEKLYKGGIKGFLKDAGDYAQKVIPTLGPKINEAFTKAFNYLKDMSGPAKDLLLKVGAALSKEAAKVDWKGIGDKIFAVLGDVGKFVLGLMEKVDWGSLGSSAASGLSFLFEKAFDAAAYTIPKVAKAAWAFTKAVMLAGFEYLANDQKTAGEKAEGIGKFVGGALASGVLISMAGALTGSRILKGLGAVLLKPFTSVFRLLIGGGLARLGSGLKLFAKALGPILAIGVTLLELPAIVSSVTDLFKGGFAQSNEDMMASGEKMAGAFFRIFDTILFGIPSMLGKYLGITKGTLSAFYEYLVMRTEFVFNGLRAGFDLFAKSLELIWHTLKGNVSFVFEKIKYMGVNAFAKVSDAALGFVESVERGVRLMGSVAGPAMVNFVSSVRSKLLDAEDLFGVFKNYVVGVFSEIAIAIESGLIDNLKIMQDMLKKMPSVMQDRLPGAKAFMSMDLERLRISKKLGLDEETRAGKERERIEDINKRRKAVETERLEYLKKAGDLFDVNQSVTGDYRRNLKASLEGNLSSRMATMVAKDRAFMDKGAELAGDMTGIKDRFVRESADVDVSFFEVLSRVDTREALNAQKTSSEVKSMSPPSMSAPEPVTPKPLSQPKKPEVVIPSESDSDLKRISASGFNQVTSSMNNVAKILQDGIKVILPEGSRRPSENMG